MIHTCHVPFLSLGLSTARLNPLQSTSSHGKINQSSWPNQTNKSKKKYEAMVIMHKRVQKTQLIFMNRSDHNLTNSSDPNYTPQKVITSNRSPKTPTRTLY